VARPEVRELFAYFSSSDPVLSTQNFSRVLVLIFNMIELLMIIGMIPYLFLKVISSYKQLESEQDG
jgi:hypothetical protein